MKRIKKLSYFEFWERKGEYGIERVRRMIVRKKKRHDKAVARRITRAKERYGGYWKDENAQRHQHCEMGGICEYPCNGDC